MKEVVVFNICNLPRFTFIKVWYHLPMNIYHLLQTTLLILGGVQEE